MPVLRGATVPVHARHDQAVEIHWRLADGKEHNERRTVPLSFPQPGERANVLRPGELDLSEAERIARMALDFHRHVEGEYGCPGAECPGVLRLVALFTAAIGIGRSTDRMQIVARAALTALLAEGKG